MVWLLESHVCTGLNLSPSEKPAGPRGGGKAVEYKGKKSLKKYGSEITKSQNRKGSDLGGRCSVSDLMLSPV